MIIKHVEKHVEGISRAVSIGGECVLMTAAICTQGYNNEENNSLLYTVLMGKNLPTTDLLPEKAQTH